MYVLMATREQLVMLLRPGGVGIEIGVAAGNFSQVLLDVARPAKLHLVDPWDHQLDPAYQADVNNVSQQESDRRYRAVCARFDALARSGTVTIHRSTSAAAASSFPDAYFDWIYIDGAHHYEACASDLRLYAPKLKSDGLILGHDYSAGEDARRMNFGVVQAVNEFVAAGAAEFLALTHEQFPTYVLAKRPVQSSAVEFMSSALLNHEVSVEIRRPETRRFEQSFAIFRQGDKVIAERLILTFE